MSSYSWRAIPVSHFGQAGIPGIGSGSRSFNGRFPGFPSIFLIAVGFGRFAMKVFKCGHTRVGCGVVAAVQIPRN